MLWLRIIWLDINILFTDIRLSWINYKLRRIDYVLKIKEELKALNNTKKGDKNELIK